MYAADLRPAAVSRRVIDAALAEPGAPRDPAQLGVLVLSRLRDRLGRQIGVDSFDALAERSCAQVRARGAAYQGLVWRPGAVPVLTGLGATRGEAIARIAAIIEGIMDILGRFVGDEVAARLVAETVTGAEGPARGVGKESS